MSKPQKFRQGRIIRTMDELGLYLNAGRWIYWRHKPLHPTFINCMTFGTIRGAIKAKILRLAILNEKGE